MRSRFSSSSSSPSSLLLSSRRGFAASRLHKTTQQCPRHLVRDPRPHIKATPRESGECRSSCVYARRMDETWSYFFPSPASGRAKHFVVDIFTHSIFSPCFLFFSPCFYYYCYCCCCCHFALTSRSTERVYATANTSARGHLQRSNNKSTKQPITPPPAATCGSPAAALIRGNSKYR